MNIKYMAIEKVEYKTKGSEIMDKLEAIKVIQDESRSIITTEYAIELADALGYKMRIKPKNYNRAIQTQPGIGINQLVMDMVKQTGKTPKHSPYIGAGRSAEYETLTNLKILTETNTKKEEKENGGSKMTKQNRTEGMVKK